MTWIWLDKKHLLRADHIIAVARSDSSASKRLIRDVQPSHYLLDLTSGRKRGSVIALDTGHVVVAAMSVEELGKELVKRARKEPGE